MAVEIVVEAEAGAVLAAVVVSVLIRLPQRWVPCAILMRIKC